ncbi:MAG: hypothetical protein AAGF83_06175 [Cyanobacteria bacterium P01_G01_bin.67]
MKTSVWYESLLQRDLMYWLEFDPDVVSYTTSTKPLKYYNKVTKELYYPDFQIIRHQKKQVVDLKFQKAIKSTKYRQLYPILCQVCRDAEWEYTALTELQIHQEPTISNIKLLYRYAREDFSVDEYENCLSILKSTVPASLSEICELLDCQNIRKNVLFKLLFHSFVEINLKEFISPNSRITAVASKLNWEILFNA